MTTETSPFEERAEELLSSVFGGMHHVCSLKKLPNVWTCVHSGGLSALDIKP